jgi:hypothetical protein
MLRPTSCGFLALLGADAPVPGQFPGPLRDPSAIRQAGRQRSRSEPEERERKQRRSQERRRALPRRPPQALAAAHRQGGRGVDPAGFASTGRTATALCPRHPQCEATEFPVARLRGKLHGSRLDPPDRRRGSDLRRRGTDSERSGAHDPSGARSDPYRAIRAGREQSFARPESRGRLEKSPASSRVSLTDAPSSESFAGIPLSSSKMSAVITGALIPTRLIRRVAPICKQLALSRSESA